MRWVGHAASMEGKKIHEGFWWRIVKEKKNFENLGVDGRITLIFILKEKGTDDEALT